MSSSPAPLRSRMPRIAEAAVQRARLTVVPRTRTKAARVPFVTLVTLVLLAGVVGLLLFNTSMQQASFATTSLEQQASSLSAREQTLRMELDELRNPQRVAEAAQGMGMVPAVNPAFLDLRTNQVVGAVIAAEPLHGLRIRPRRLAKPAVLNPAPLFVDVPAEPTRSKTLASGEKPGTTRPVLGEPATRER